MFDTTACSFRNNFLIVAVAWACFSSQNAFADSIFIEIEGIFDNPEVVFPSLQSGDAWTAWMVMDTSTPDGNAQNWIGAYGSAVAYSFSFDSFSMTAPSVSSGVVLYNDDPLTIDGYDSLFVSFSENGPLPVFDGIAINNFQVSLHDETETIFQSTSLSEIIGATFSDFDSDLSFLKLNNGDSIGHVTSLSITAVPIPAAFWLFGSALGLLGWIRRKTA